MELVIVQVIENRVIERKNKISINGDIRGMDFCKKKNNSEAKQEQNYRALRLHSYGDDSPVYFSNR